MRTRSSVLLLTIVASMLSGCPKSASRVSSTAPTRDGPSASADPCPQTPMLDELARRVWGVASGAGLDTDCLEMSSGRGTLWLIHGRVLREGNARTEDRWEALVTPEGERLTTAYGEAPRDAAFGPVHWTAVDLNGDHRDELLRVLRLRNHSELVIHGLSPDGTELVFLSAVPLSHAGAAPSERCDGRFRILEGPPGRRTLEVRYQGADCPQPGVHHWQLEAGRLVEVGKETPGRSRP